MEILMDKTWECLNIQDFERRKREMNGWINMRVYEMGKQNTKRNKQGLFNLSIYSSSPLFILVLLSSWKWRWRMIQPFFRIVHRFKWEAHFLNEKERFHLANLSLVDLNLNHLQIFLLIILLLLSSLPIHFTSLLTFHLYELPSLQLFVVVRTRPTQTPSNIFVWTVFVLLFADLEAGIIIHSHVIHYPLSLSISIFSPLQNTSLHLPVCSLIIICRYHYQQGVHVCMYTLIWYLFTL